MIEQKVGERTVLDVLNAQQTLLNSEIELINQRKNKEIIKSQVFYLMGESDQKLLAFGLIYPMYLLFLPYLHNL